MILFYIMKRHVFILASLLCTTFPAHASDCVGAFCDIEPMMYVAPTPETVTETVVATDAVNNADEYTSMTEYIYAEPMRQVRLLSVKPVESDNRPPLFDGSHDKKSDLYTKTVSTTDGAPLWDDGVASYRDKDFDDWYLWPMDELYVRDGDEKMSPMELYAQNMADAAATRARVEELLLSPQKPSDNLWTSDNVTVVADVAPVAKVITTTEILVDDGCPFETETECNIWRRKPIVRETVSPRSPKIRTDMMDDFLNTILMDKNIDASHPAAAPMVARYKMLMKSANACCTDGFVYSLKRAGASDGLVYKFMADDANFYGFGARCLMMTDNELDTKYPNTATASVAADVRNGCLCRNRQWYTAMLAPFVSTYNEVPEFRDAKFNYTYTDGLQRNITVSINTDVQNVLNQLTLCP